MTENDRDTHFQGFARLLYEDWLDTCGGHIDFDSDNALDRQEFEAFIAQRAYDLVVHVIKNLSIHDFELYTYEVAKEEITEDDTDIFSHIPDLTEWPPIE